MAAEWLIRRERFAGFVRTCRRGVGCASVRAHWEGDVTGTLTSTRFIVPWWRIVGLLTGTKNRQLRTNQPLTQNGRVGMDMAMAIQSMDTDATCANQDSRPWGGSRINICPHRKRLCQPLRVRQWWVPRYNGTDDQVNVIERTHSRSSSVRLLGLGFGMLYRVYTRSPRLNAAKQIHTSPPSHAQKQKRIPQTQRGSRPPAATGKVEEEVAVDEPYGE